MTSVAISNGLDYPRADPCVAIVRQGNTYYLLLFIDLVRVGT